MFMSNETMMSPSTGSIQFDFNEAWGSVASSCGGFIGWSNNTANGY